MMQSKVKVPYTLTRSYIKSGGTNPDFPAELARSVIAEVEQENWDCSYIREKAQRILDFIDIEYRRLRHYQELERTRSGNFKSIEFSTEEELKKFIDDHSDTFRYVGYATSRKPNGKFGIVF